MSTYSETNRYYVESVELDMPTLKIEYDDIPLKSIYDKDIEKNQIPEFKDLEVLPMVMRKIIMYQNAKSA